MKTHYNHSEVEAKWRQVWEQLSLYATPELTADDQEKYYCLDMYPYPSGSGLHVGHPRGYLGTDVVSRYFRMKGRKVMHPIGFDSFGLPAENYAIKTGIHPQETTDTAIATFKEQIGAVGLSYDWDREISSHDPEYYKWTQWLFLFLYEKGLAYKKEAPVNWCPTDNTTLANEQVIDGKCERCDTEVVQKNMEQWFFKITDYADRLIDDLDKIDWPESTKAGQRNWINRSEGANIDFATVDLDGKALEPLKVFSTAHDTIFGATFMVIAPEHDWLDKHQNQITNWSEIAKYVKQASHKTELQRQQQKDKTGVQLQGVMAVNPINDVQISIFVGDYVLNGYGTGAIMAVPGHDERDLEFAKKYKLPVVEVVESDKFVSYSAEVKSNLKGFRIKNSGEFDGQDFATAREGIMQKLEELKVGKRQTEYRLRDWLVSRQRYWGPPIPIVYDPEGNAHAVDESDLPVLLPHDVDFKPTGESPLVHAADFHKSAEEKYGKGWRREVDTMDTFVDSSWYFLRFTDPHNKQEFASKQAMNAWMPVDLYVGGAEHTVLHLLYARFITKVLFDEGFINFDEPFMKLRHQGTVLSNDGRRMSKRWGNTITPDQEIASYGTDTFRMYEMFMGPFEATMPWDTKTEIGVYRFVNKIWDLQDRVSANMEDEEQEVWVNKVIQKVQTDIENMSFNTAVAKMMEFVNFLTKQEQIAQSVWEKFLKVIAPFAIYISEELWSQLGHKDSIHRQTWPEFDPTRLKQATVPVAVQVNGRLRDTLNLDADLAEDMAVDQAKKSTKVLPHLAGKQIKKQVYVPGKVINFVV